MEKAVSIKICESKFLREEFYDPLICLCFLLMSDIGFYWCFLVPYKTFISDNSKTGCGI